MKKIASILAVILLGIMANSALAKGSTCYGTTSNGRLEAGVQLPKSGPNFVG